MTERYTATATLGVFTVFLSVAAACRAVAAAVRGGDGQCAAERLAALVRLPSGGLQDDVGIVVVAHLER